MPPPPDPPLRCPRCSTGAPPHAELLLRVAPCLSAHETLDAVLTSLVDLVVTAVGAERGSIFLYDERTDELYTRVAQGAGPAEIRLAANTGIAGHVFASGRGLLIPDAYADRRFNAAIDRRTGFRTRAIICAPMLLADGHAVGVAQCLNKHVGAFDADDLELLQAIGSQAAAALRMARQLDVMHRDRERQQQYRDLIAAVTHRNGIDHLFGRVMDDVAQLLSAECALLFLHDTRREELWSRTGRQAAAAEIRIGDGSGVEGLALRSGETVNVAGSAAGPDARSLLCVPVTDPEGRTLGVVLARNKRGGRFSGEDERQLRDVATHLAVALQSASLSDDVHEALNYGACVLQSMSNGVITLDDSGTVVACNAAAARLLGRDQAQMIGQPVDGIFCSVGSWLPALARMVHVTGAAQQLTDAPLSVDGRRLSVNATVRPLLSASQRRLGTMIVLDDVTAEKRARAAIGRYLDPQLAERVLSGGDSILGGRSTTATILFADIRDFSALSRQLGPQQTVALLNQYFTLMLTCVEANRGVLDKFIGDALMATFGVEVADGDEDDRAVATAVAMLRVLADWNRERPILGLPGLRVGIGINSAQVVSGNIGSPDRMDYTVIGDGVNLAAQLQQASKHYRVPILISDETARRLHGRFRLRPVDHVTAKGGSGTILVHEVLDHFAETEFPHRDQVLNDYAAGFDAYGRGSFTAALAAFERARAAHPGDHLSHLYVERCRRVLADRPCDDGNSVWPAA